MPKLHNLKSSFCHQQKPQQVKELTLDKFTNDSIPFNDDTNKKLEFERLFQLLPLILPDEESIASSICKLQTEKTKSSIKVLTFGFQVIKSDLENNIVALHLSDKNWMVKHISGIVNQKKQGVSKESIKQFLGMSSFQQACQAHMQKYFRVKIKYFMSKPYIEDKEERLQEPFTCKGFVDFKSNINCDKRFREHLRCCFSLDGFDHQTVEREIERNADLWRPQIMKKAIDFYYYLHIKNDDYYVMKSSQNKLLKKTFKENCFTYREYKYYQKHKHVIDELGLATQNMKLTPGQAHSVKNKINKLGSLIYDNVISYEM